MDADEGAGFNDDMNRHERRRQERERRRRTKVAKTPSGPVNSAVDEKTAEAFRAALALQQAGRLAEAERAWQDMRRDLPDHDGINTNLATVFWRQGKFDEAADACGRAIAANPDLAEAHALLGAIGQARGRAADAIRCFERAVELKPALVTAWVSLADLYKAGGEMEKALEACEKAEELEPGRADVLNTSGVVQQSMGEFAAAEAAFRRAAVSAPPGEPTAQIQPNLGALLELTGRHEAAVIRLEKAVEAAPRYAQAHNTLGAALKSLRRFDEAEAAFRRALEVAPDMAAAESNLGTIYGLKRQWPEALRCYERAVELNPDSAEAHNNRGNVLHCTGRHAEAHAAFERALALSPAFADPHLNRGLLLLLEGRWKEGWPEFEWRWQTPQMAPFRRDFPVPQWDGAGRPAETLLLHAEQGMGDTLQFIRYAAPARQRVGRVVVECQAPLIPLLEGMDGIDDVVPRGTDLPAFDLHLPMLSLPAVFETEIADLAGAGPYLHPPAGAEVALPGPGERLKVGLVWAGNPLNPNDPSRSTHVERLRPLLEVPGCEFFSLQHGDPGDQIAEAGLSERIHDLRPSLTDFGATAAIVRQLDLVISICTSVAHLAGGMGAETWVILSTDADWRWLMDRDDSPWYPTARLFRQRALDDWDELAARVAAALGERAAG